MAENRPSTAVPTTSFAELGVPAVIVTALAKLGIDSPFPIQAATLPDSMAGRDVLGRGRTGSGKTYAFVLPVLARLSTSASKRAPKRPRALILAPTRELASQIEASVTPLAHALNLKAMTVFGGVGANPQITSLRNGVDILVACPGRLEDLLSGGHVSLDSVEITVLDEADHMADLGFLPAVRRLLDKTPKNGQRMLFSATLDAGVDVLVKRFLTNPITHSVDSAQSPVSTMAHHLLQVNAADRLPILVDLTAAPGRTLVFTRTKHGAKKLTKQLIASGVPAVELHGNLAQNARTRNLLAFSDGTANTLVATDIAARGIHVDDVTLVVHADPPVEHKAYLHRSGRTARAGAGGTVVTLMTDDQVSEVNQLIRKAAIKPTTTRIGAGHPLLSELAPGERSFTEPPAGAAEAIPVTRGETGRGRGARSGSGQRASGSGRSGGGSGQRASGSGRSGGSAGQRATGAGQRSSGSARAAGGRAAGGSGASRSPVKYSTSSSGGAAAPRTSGAAAFSASARPRAGR